MQDRLVFLIGAPRSGTTLTARMLGAHPDVFAPAEPHLMPPLAHLGFHERVDEAPYDPVVTQIGLRELVSGLPAGERDYLDGLRRFTDYLYARSIEHSGRRIYLDKTPAYALVLDFLTKLYPSARYVVLTRHPIAIWSSYVDSFFAGDAAAAHARNPVLERYVPAIARFLRERPAPLIHVRYEELVRDPEKHLREICAFVGIDFQPGMIQYGDAEGPTRPVASGLGDPIRVDREKRPTTQSVGKWMAALAGDPVRLAQCREIAARLADEDLAAWGFIGPELRKALSEIDAGRAGPGRAQLTRYALERRLLVRLRRNIRTNALGRLVRRVRTICDVLLR
ncbi:MAG TPA: sulfotransferase [Myxococcota bacterium]|nr:sulfotransferase [Myxococcota bacterium]